MKEEKPLTPAQEYIKERRMSFPCLYPTTEHLMLRLLSCSDTVWKDGTLVDDYNHTIYPLGLTEDGWESAIHAQRVPTSWTDPHTNSPLLRIPDNAHESWLDVISSLCYFVAKLRPAAVEQWVRLHEEFAGTCEPYAKNAIERKMKGFHATREACVKIAARVELIRFERLPKYVRPPCVEVGASVRFITGSEVANVVSMVTMPDMGALRPVAVLDRELEGIHFHFVEKLVPVPTPTPLCDLCDKPVTDGHRDIVMNTPRHKECVPY